MARQKRIEGDILAIELSDRSIAYARVLHEPLVAFYDYKTTDSKQPPIRPILESPVLWRIWVMNNAITSGRWRRIGHAPIEDNLQSEPVFFKQDSITGKLSLYRAQVEYPATLEQCLNLERAAVWSPEHVESRLLDHFAGRPNKWAESLSVRRRRTD